MSKDANFSGANFSGTDFMGADVSYCKSTAPLLNISYKKDSISLIGNILQIGCERHTVEDWLTYYEKIGRDNHYSESDIREYGLIIKLCADLSRSK